MNIRCLKVGEMGTNCYLLSDEETGDALIIDPGEEGDYISTTILENKLTPVGILLTHGHFDHCLGVLDLFLNFNPPIYLHPLDQFLYEKAHFSGQHFSGLTSPHLPPITHFLKDHQVLSFGHLSLSVIHTPGHTPGSVCFYTPPHLFTGDTLFVEGVGRTDLSYSSPKDLRHSLAKISQFPKNTFIYPGHEDYGVFLPKTLI